MAMECSLQKLTQSIEENEDGSIEGLRTPATTVIRTVVWGVYMLKRLCSSRVHYNAYACTRFPA